MLPSDLPDPALPDPDLPDAVLLDMDGTLVDTEPYWMATEAEVIARHGGSWSAEQGLQLVGNDLRTSARVILDETGIDVDPDDLVTELVGAVAARVRRDGVPWRPGARELLAALADAGVPRALVTMSYRVLTAAVTETSPVAFDTVVAGDEVTHGKPHPEPYLIAARRLGTTAARCVAVEDSAVGATSALAAGAATVAVPLMVPVPAQPGLSRLRTLEDLDLGLLARIAGGEVVDQLEPERSRV
ncbi:HAD family phosphatase [Georgenia sp. TF02-10]|uniref:HAD family hydrolase n=1 Tax=Georgenia sp. TF02-10 TaxID=2917725 RepID=UPI001FA7EC80|nr:HAD family phosphatase [Georgenia sp. TF02-10]UNX56132.1 HAD family phosphatase [Georgenia sp. TF02-10]